MQHLFRGCEMILERDGNQQRPDGCLLNHMFTTQKNSIAQPTKSSSVLAAAAKLAFEMMVFAQAIGAEARGPPTDLSHPLIILQQAAKPPL